MSTQRSPYPRMGIVLLALIGILDSLYLSLTRLQKDIALVCPTGGGCETVQNSPWSTIPPGNGVPVAFIGVAGYGLLFLLGMVALQTDYLRILPTFSIPLILLLFSCCGILFSTYLISLQLFIVKAICFWCMVSAGTQFVICGLSFLDWRAWRVADR